MTIVALKCPHCNGDLQMEDDREFGFCQYCGTKIMIQQEIININNQINGSAVNNTYNGQTTVHNTFTINNKSSSQSKYPILEDGHYEGPLVDGKPHGKGIFIWSTGVRYEGDFVHGVIEGFGRKDYPDGYYEGDFRNNNRHGYGKYFGKDRSYYDGEYRDDMKNGHGYEKYITNKGYVAEYDGDIVNDVWEGMGILKINDYVYVGEFRNGEYHGEGVQTWGYYDTKKTGRYDSKRTIIKYEGHFVNGRQQGVSKRYYPGNDSWDLGVIDSHGNWVGEMYRSIEGVVKKHYIDSKGIIQPPVTFFTKPSSYDIKFERINSLLENYYRGSNDTTFKLNVKASSIVSISSVEVYLDDIEIGKNVTITGMAQFLVHYGKHTIHVKCGKKSADFDIDVTEDCIYNVNVGFKNITIEKYQKTSHF